jgi:hypothetical protein
MHARQIGPLNLGAKPYVRKKSQIVFVGAGYRVLLAATDSNQVHAGDPQQAVDLGECIIAWVLKKSTSTKTARFWGIENAQATRENRL